MISLCGVYQHDHHEPCAFDAYANAQQLHGAYGDQLRARHSDDGDEHVHQPHALSNGEPCACAHDGYHGHGDEQVLRDVIS